MRKAGLIVMTCLLALGLRAQELKIIIGVGTSTYSRMWAPEYWWDWSGTKGGLNPFKNVRGAVVGGLGIVFPISERVALEADALYFSKGATFSQSRLSQPDPPQSESVRKEFSLQGFAVPVMAKVRLLPRPYPYIVAGVDLSFTSYHMLREYRQLDVIDPYFRLWQSQQLVHETRTFDWGPVLGIGFDIAMPMAVLELELRYQVGLPDIHSEPGDYQVRTRSFFVVAGFRI